MSVNDPRIPTIAATSEARNAFGRDSLTTAKGWAGRSDITGYTTSEIKIAHKIMLASKEALRPFYSAERVAYTKLSAELLRRQGPA